MKSENTLTAVRDTSSPECNPREFRLGDGGIFGEHI
jgi:hypothetical protein